LIVAGTAAVKGADAALRELRGLVDQAGERPETVRMAAAELMMARRYPEASVLFQEAARGGASPARLRALSTTLAGTRRIEERPVDRRDPRRVAMGALAQLMLWDLTDDDRAREAARGLLSERLQAALLSERDFQRELGRRRQESQEAA